MNQFTIESVLDWLSDSSVHPRNRVNSFQWFHVPTLLTTHIQSQPTKESNEVLSQLLQRMMTILDECFDCQTAISNKRLLHSSLSQLSQSPSLDPKIKRKASQCLTSLDTIKEGPFVLVAVETLESVDKLRRDHDQQQARLNQSERTIAQLEKEKAAWMEERKVLVSQVQSLQREKEQMRVADERRAREMNHPIQLEETVRSLILAQQTIQQMPTELPQRSQPIVASDVIVAFSPEHYRMRGWTVTRINSTGNVGCFTRPVSTGIHRLSITTEANDVMIGVCDAAECTNHLTDDISESPKAALMNWNGYLISGRQYLAQNAEPEKGLEWSAEADLEKRTLHFFINGIQLEHHFVNIPVPLVFALNAYWEDATIGITLWGELKESSVMLSGTQPSPHNPVEVVQASVRLMSKPNTSIPQLSKYIGTFLMFATETGTLLLQTQIEDLHRILTICKRVVSLKRLDDFLSTLDPPSVLQLDKFIDLIGLTVSMPDFDVSSNSG
ncbi:hypothetical protein BLNAU_14467 [Blattamonas nauphoetae]|uniref:SPRY domain-containing protein n=1 Tax=Blattamonas nauphoetae TaxID=2049346 RepID=A0ABQ9XK99_9EUKA|nr:hypothetical protein BLNAU_14467 [Blattamonas nauphoetae]